MADNENTRAPAGGSEPNDAQVEVAITAFSTFSETWTSRDRMRAALKAALASAPASAPLAWHPMSEPPPKPGRYPVAHRGGIGGDAYWNAPDKPGWSQLPDLKPTHWTYPPGRECLAAAPLWAKQYDDGTWAACRGSDVVTPPTYPTAEAALAAARAAAPVADERAAAALYAAWKESRKQALAEVLEVLDNHGEGSAVRLLDFLGVSRG